MISYYLIFISIDYFYNYYYY